MGRYFQFKTAGMPSSFPSISKLKHILIYFDQLTGLAGWYFYICVIVKIYNNPKILFYGSTLLFSRSCCFLFLVNCFFNVSWFYIAIVIKLCCLLDMNTSWGIFAEIKNKFAIFLPPTLEIVCFEFVLTNWFLATGQSICFNTSKRQCIFYGRASWVVISTIDVRADDNFLCLNWKL